MGRALDYRVDSPGGKSRLRHYKTYELCFVDYNVHVRLITSVIKFIENNFFYSIKKHADDQGCPLILFRVGLESDILYTLYSQYPNPHTLGQKIPCG